MKRREDSSPQGFGDSLTFAFDCIGGDGTVQLRKHKKQKRDSPLFRWDPTKQGRASKLAHSNSEKRLQNGTFLTLISQKLEGN